MQVFLLSLVFCASLLAGGDELFHDLSFAKALKKAKAEHKLVFVDFYTTWCGPCKMLDKHTWTHPKVKQWLAENTVALKVDAERQRGLARKYRVGSYPTLMFLDPDGKMIHGISGFRPPDRFLSEARMFGKDPFLKLKLAQEMAKQGVRDRALILWLWCLDYGTEVNPQFAEARKTLLGHLIKLGETEKSVKKALKTRGEWPR